MTVTYSLCGGDGMRSRGLQKYWRRWRTILDQDRAIFSPRMTRWRSVRWIIWTATAAKPGRDVLICAFSGGAELRALQKKGEVAVIGALPDDTQLARQAAEHQPSRLRRAPWKPYIALADKPC